MPLRTWLYHMATAAKAQQDLKEANHRLEFAHG